MDKTLQQRLVGAIVLVALGVIFIPALLDGSGYKSRQQETTEVPSKPSFPSTKEEKVTPIPTPVEITKKEVEKKKAETPPRAIESWALQVGTFDDKKNAEALRDRLRKAKHTAYVETAKVDGKTTYRVRIGPELDKARIEQLKERLNKEQKISGFVVKHPG